MEEAQKEPFAELKKLAARLDVEISNAASCVSGPVSTIPTSAVTAFEKAAAFEAQFKLLELRLQAVVKEKMASIQEVRDCLENALNDNNYLLPKLRSLGLKVPDNVLPVLQHVTPPNGRHLAGETSAPSWESPCSLQPTVTKLEPVFSSIAMGSSHLGNPGPSVLTQRPQPSNSEPAGHSPSRCCSQPKSMLERYLKEIERDDTMQFLRCRPLPVEDFEEAKSTSPASCTLVKESSESFEFRGLAKALDGVTYTCGVQPLPKTPEPTKSDFEEEENRTNWTRTELKWGKSVPLTPTAPESPDFVVPRLTFKERGAEVLPKMPEPKKKTTPVLKESNVGAPP